MQKIGKGNLSTTELLEKAGYIKQIQSGLYVHMHLMKKLMNNIESVVKGELENVNCLEIGLNQLQSADLWKQTGRYDTYGAEMFKLKDRNNKEMIFTGTNEELVTTVAKDYVRSYKDLSFTFYQINNKFRDEMRCNGGLVRSKEFIMMDAYSFHKNKEELEEFYATMRECYLTIFNRLGLKVRIEVADSGEIGGSVSEEFVVETSEGDIEVGHIFQLDTKYSESIGATYADKDNTNKHIVMGCYGIGISRLAQVIADVSRIDNCFNFSNRVSAYQYGIIVANVNDKKQLEEGEYIYEEMLRRGYTVYLDDRDLRIGQKLNEIDIIGTTNKILIGNKVENYLIEKKTKSNSDWVEQKSDLFIQYI